ncbi:MAG: hypothetical protein QXE04_00940, partial [Thermoplasmatales archaeon]
MWELGSLLVEVTLKLSGEEVERVIRAIIKDHEKYVKCRVSRGKAICKVSGSPNDVRKTLNEFLESVNYIESI